jgi:hypothetical protein
MDYGLVALVAGTIVSAVTATAAAYFGRDKYVKVKGKAQALSKALKTVVDAFDDDNVSPEEFKEIVDQAKELLKGE